MTLALYKLNNVSAVMFRGGFGLTSCAGDVVGS